MNLASLDLEGLLGAGLGGRAGTFSVRFRDDQTHAGEGRFPIYSIAKVVIAVLLVQQADEERLSLDDPLARWHPEVPGADAMTLRQVLRHRAGLRDYGSLRAYHEALRSSSQRAWSRATYGEHTWLRGPVSEPGERFLYSNPGYRLLREIAERVDGGGFAELVARRITGPLGLVRTRVLESAADYAELVPSTTTRFSTDGSPRDLRTMDPDWVFHGTLSSTAPETLRLLDAFANGSLVSREGLAAMTQLVPIGQELPGRGEPSYGLGLMGDPHSPHGLSWGHNGGGPGYQASVFHLPEHDLSACALCADERDGAAEALVRRVFEALVQPR